MSTGDTSASEIGVCCCILVVVYLVLFIVSMLLAGMLEGLVNLA